MQNGDKMKKIRGRLASGREIKSPVNRRQRLQNELRRIFFIVIGNLIYATIVSLFLLPAKLMTSGTTGIALVVNHITGFSISAFVLIFNILMLLVGWVLLGGRFALSTVASSLIYPVALEICSRVFDGVVITENRMLCTIYTGVGVGLALGLVLRSGASTGGMDIPTLALNRYFKIPVSVSLYAFDFCIMLAQAFYNPVENVLYGILLILLTSLALDKMMLMGTTRTEVKIISRKTQEICDGILTKLDRGVTILNGEGGYLHQEAQVVFSVVSNRELPQIERIVRDIDPESFMVVSRVSEVWGRGFSMSKKYVPDGAEQTDGSRG